MGLPGALSGTQLKENIKAHENLTHKLGECNNLK